MMKLKPCPFCGGLPSWTVFNGGYILTCGNPNCPAIVRTEGITERQAGNKWNTRAEESAEQKNAHWDIACGSYTPFCSNCGEEPPAYEMTAYCPHCGCKMVTRRNENT